MTAEPNFKYVNSDFTVFTNNRYLVDTSSGPITCTLPQTAEIGCAVYFVDANNSFTTNKFTIDATDYAIDGASTKLIAPSICLGVVFTGSGWRTYGTEPNKVTPIKPVEKTIIQAKTTEA